MGYKIVDVDYGLSSVYSDGTIEINRKIQGKLREKIIKHEFSHTLGNYSMKDYRTDFNSKSPYFLESLMFCFRNPEGFINFMPLLYSYYLHKWTFNFTSLIPFVLWGTIFSIMSSLIFKITIIYPVLAWINIIIVLNVCLLIYTHIHVRKARKHLV